MKKLCYLMFSICFWHPIFGSEDLMNIQPQDAWQEQGLKDAYEESTKNSLLTHVPSFSFSPDQKQAVHNAHIILASLCTTFSNVIGRFFLISFFSYKSYKNLHGLVYEKSDRSEHAAKAACFAVATFLLAQDGYTWLLHQNPRL